MASILTQTSGVNLSKGNRSSRRVQKYQDPRYGQNQLNARNLSVQLRKYSDNPDLIGRVENELKEMPQGFSTRSPIFMALAAILLDRYGDPDPDRGIQLIELPIPQTHYREVVLSNFTPDRYQGLLDRIAPNTSEIKKGKLKPSDVELENIRNKMELYRYCKMILFFRQTRVRSGEAVQFQDAAGYLHQI